MNKNNPQLEALKKQIYNQLVHSAEDRIAIKNEVEASSPSILRPIAITFFLLLQFSLGLPIYVFVGTVFVLILVIRSYLKTSSSPTWVDYYIKNGNAYSCIREHFFPNLKANRDINNKMQAFARNKFLLKHKLNAGEMDISQKFFYKGSVNSVETQIFQVDAHSLLLYFYEYKSSTIQNFYVQSQASDLIKNLALPAVQTFNYFPEVEEAFNFYTEQKGEAAQFLQANEAVFIQLAKFTKFNFVFSIVKDEIFCLLNGIDLALFADADEEVNPDEKEIESYVEPMQQLKHLMLELQKLR